MDKKGKAENAANALRQPSAGRRIWYDFGCVKGGSDEFPKDKTFNQYNNIFFYRYIRLEHTSPKSLVETIVKFVRLIRDNEATILQQLEKVL